MVRQCPLQSHRSPSFKSRRSSRSAVTIRSPLPRTLLFDLYGTLVPGGSRLERDFVSFRVAEILEVDRVKFTAVVRATFDERVRGSMGGLPETIEELARRVGGFPTSSQVALAAEERLTFTRRLLENVGARSDLVALKARGHQLGVVTDCSAETPLAWTTTWLNDVIDIVTFSCELGIRKPDPSMYLDAARRLNVLPEECTFVGDGGSTELSGGSAVSMCAILLSNLNLRDTDRLDEELSWDGERIGSLSDLFVN